MIFPEAGSEQAIAQAFTHGLRSGSAVLGAVAHLMVTLCTTRNGILEVLRSCATSWLSRALGAAYGKEAGIDQNQTLKWPIIVHKRNYLY